MYGCEICVVFVCACSYVCVYPEDFDKGVTVKLVHNLCGVCIVRVSTLRILTGVWL